MKNPEEFWQNKHKVQSPLWLTGSYLNALCRVHEFEVPKNQNVLEVGVGIGRATREFAKDNDVYAVDISRTALDNLGNIAKKYLTADMVDIPDDTIDFAICHLVFQHCENEAIGFILDQVIRVLKPGGQFFLQSGDSKQPMGVNIGRTKRRELIWHTPDWIKARIALAGGDIVSERLSQRTPDIYWQLLKITKAAKNI